MHHFPNAVKFPERFKTWVDLVGGKLETASDYEYYQKKLVCDKHFTARDRVRYNRLGALAIPSLHLHGVYTILVFTTKFMVDHIETCILVRKLKCLSILH